MLTAVMALLERIRPHGFVLDIVALLNGRIISIALGIIGSVIVARLLGPSDKGIVTTILAVPGMAYSLAELGIRQATVYYVGKQVYDDQSVISTINFLSIFTSVLTISVVFISYIATDLASRYGYGLIIVALATIPFHLNSTYANGILLGKKNIRAITVATVLQPAVYLVLLLAVYFLPAGLRLQGVILATLISTVFVASYLLRKVTIYGRLEASYIPGLPWKFIRKGFMYALALFTLNLHYRIDILILERVSTTEEVGIYSVGVGWAQLLWLLPAVIGTVNFSYSAGSDNAHAHSLKTAKLMRVTLYGGAVPCLVLFLTSRWFIPLVYGQAYARSGVAVQALMLGIWVSLIFKILHSDLAGRGKPNAALWVYGMALVLNVLLNFWWAPRYGAVGAGWASSVTYTFGGIVYTFVYARLSQIPIWNLLLPQKNDWYFWQRKIS